jgi:tetratricopeptide (TPR) repeat protein
MAKRRTDDVVHVVMTDHYIRRRQPGRNLVAPIAEQHDTAKTAYRGDVSLYYPSTLSGPDQDLYVATAQVYAGANLQSGIPRLQQAIERHKPRQPEFYHQLAEAYFRAGNDELAVKWYQQSLQLDPGYLPAIRNLGATLTRMGRYSEAVAILRRAPDDAAALNNLGEAFLDQGQIDAAAESLRKALQIDPDSPEALNNLGRALDRKGDKPEAIECWLAAIRVKPDYARAHGNLANALHASGRWEEARRHFMDGLRDPSDAVVRFNYGTALAERGAIDEAEKQLAGAVRLDPTLADAHLNLGNIQAMRHQPAQAVVHFRNALRARPDFGRARLNLGIALMQSGRTAEAMEQFREASHDRDAEVRRLAESALQQITRPD